MAKLKCVSHQRRVMVLQTRVVHRSDGSRCLAEKLKLGDKFMRPEEVSGG